MQKVRKIVGAANAYQLGLFGRQIGIAVLDSGIYPHKDFVDGVNRIAVFRDLIGGHSHPYDDNGHGTHIAGIIAGSGSASEGKYMGMAPKAHLVILKVLDAHGNGSVKNVCEAIEWTVRHSQQYQIRIMNISVGANVQKQSKESRMLEEAVEYAWNHGLIVVAAAGNDGPKEKSITAPGTSRKIITVGAAPEKGHHQQTTACLFSGRGPTAGCICKPDVVAPGVQIVSCGYRPEMLYTTRSGTSMAAPVVSGGLALLLSRYPEMSNKQVKIWLRAYAQTLSLPREYQGWGQFYLSKEALLHPDIDA